ncbi:DUF2513 domain-containing protein [Enterococcus faecium]|uniref:DUF2513 domain-containing protein n=1 Tax=Enterococcus faecium TaxID=1352 RepID=A0A2G0E8R9_ENTFC|nr:DUF2513 domain-containing protein [Enterococcus faecium]PHL20883.1 DUF2513 domain-containing protein [Enterococcus faecium]
MKLNQDCVRDILLELEKKLDLNTQLYKNDLLTFSSYEKYGEKDFFYTLLKLTEAGYLNAKVTAGANNPVFSVNISSISWKGHEFLDSVRDNEVWKQTKSIIFKFSSVSITTIENIASNVITQLISKQLNI